MWIASRLSSGDVSVRATSSSRARSPATMNPCRTALRALRFWLDL